MTWRPLRVSPFASAHLPPLLISANFTQESYTVQLTDLTYIWGESLDRSTIIRRSKEEGTSIDPGDSDQFQIFIDKIKLALEGADGTTLALTVNQDADRPPLVLSIAVALPGGLAPLAWPIHLSVSPQTQLTNQLIVPLLRTQHVRAQETASLVEVLKEKDHVIQKLMDKLEILNMDFSEIFPHAAGRAGRKMDRKKTEERVKGAGLFDVGMWKEGLSLEESRDTVYLMERVFLDNYIEAVPAHDDLREEGKERWWDGIKGITVNLGSGKVSTNGGTDKPKSVPRVAVERQDTVEDDDDAFQVQSTPAHISKSAKEPAPKDEDSTDDEDDLDAPSQQSKIPDSYPADPPPPSPPKPKKQLGKIGGKKAAARPKSPVHDDESTEDEGEDEPPQKLTGRTPQKAKSAPDADEQSTEDEDSSPKTISKKAAYPVPATVPAKSVRKLGKIGGKKERPATPEPEFKPEREPTPPSVSPAPIEAPKPKKGKLGKLGGKKKAADPEPEPKAATPEPPAEYTSPAKKLKLSTLGGHPPVAADVNEGIPMKAEEETQHRGRASTRPAKVKTPEPRETSTERANRRRAELQKELEAKAKAPTKKKRKF